MLPQPGEPVSAWLVQPGDFEFMATEGNKKNVDLLLCAWVGLLQDSPVDSTKPYGVGFRWLMQLASDWTATVVRYKKLGLAFFRSVTVDDYGHASYDPLFRSFAKTPIFREYYYWRRTRDSKVASYIMSFLWFASKAKYVNDALDQDAIAKWWEIEDRLEGIKLAPHVIEDLRKIFQRLKFQMRSDEIIFKHGPGTVSDTEGRSVQKKNGMISFHPRLDSIVDEIRRSDSPYARLILPDPEGWDHLKDAMKNGSSEESEFLLVDKDATSKRSICREPSTFQYVQQGVLNGMRGAIQRSRLGTKGKREFPLIDLNSQSNNRTMALRASLDARFATIDCSSASDTVLWELVQGIFEGHPLLDYLSGSRTYLVRVPTRDRENGGGITWGVKKFAPMGSAVCFPTQCIIFSLVAYLTHNLCIEGLDIHQYIAGNYSKPGTPLAWLTGPIMDPEDGTVVFGDDIIVLDEQVEHYMSLLSHLGFLVNRDKSFFGHQAARESCGVFAMRGKILEIHRFSTDGLEEDTFESKLSRIALANRLYVDGYWNCRNAILRSVSHAYWFFTNPDEPNRHPQAVLGWEIYDKVTVKKFRWNTQIQATQVRIKRPYDPLTDSAALTGVPEDERVLRRRQARDLRDEGECAYEYGRWLASPHIHEGADFATGGSARADVIRWRWTTVGY